MKQNSGEHEMAMGEMASNPPPQNDEGLALRELAESVGRLADVVSAEVRWTRRTLYLCIAFVLVGEGANWYRAKQLADDKLSVSPAEVLAEVKKVEQVQQTVTLNQRSLTKILEAVTASTKHTAKATEALAEVQEAEAEPNRDVRAERKAEAVSKAKDAARKAQSAVDSLR